MSQITIRNLGQDVRDMLMVHAKANGRSLEAQIRVMLATAVGLGPRVVNQTMLEELSGLQKTNNEVMAGLTLRMEKAKAHGQSTEIKGYVQRKVSGPKPANHPL